VISAVDLPERPLVSIVTPVLNRVRSIDACLSAVAAQSYPSIEHIVVDGGSTDGTLDVIREFRPRHELRWLSESDHGMYDAVNKGLELAQGDVIAYLNSDDFYLPWSVEVAVAALKGGADLVYGDLGLLQVRSNNRSTFDVQFYPPFDLTYYTHLGTLAQPTVFWRKEVTEHIGRFDSEYKLIGDCEYWLRAAVAGASFVHEEEVLAIQIDHDATLRASNPEQLKTEFERLRTTYSSMARPPTWPWMHETMKSLRWRWLQLRFMIESYRREPARWARFISFLRGNRIKVTRPARALASLLPTRFRPSWAMRLDKSMVEGKLLQLIGARAAR
jgi:glycosyltransferase involved in cell wall biosynthesis